MSDIHFSCSTIARLVVYSALFLGVSGQADAQSGITVLGSAPVTVNEATLFSFDDVSIPYTTNLVLKMVTPKKHPNNPLIPLGKPGTPDEWSVQCYGSVIRHEGKYKLWYIAINEKDLKKMPGDVHYRGAQLAYAESEDGIEWVRPNLGLVEFRGNKNNNLLLIDPPQAHGLDVLVLYEPEDPDPSKRFKMLLHMGARFDGLPAGAPIPFFSEDGLRWHIAIDAKLTNYTVASDESALPPEHFEMGGLYKWHGMYHVTGQQADPFMWLPDGSSCGRVLTTFRSSDFVTWSRTKTLSFVRDGTQSFHAPKGVGVAEEVHQNSVWNRGNVLVATYGLWHGSPKGWSGTTVDLGLLVCNDGLRYREPVSDFVFLRRGEDGEWDQGGILMSQAFENIGDETYIYYGHWDPRIGTKYLPRGGFGLVTLPRDRFASLSLKNPAKEASLITCPLKVDETAELFLNASGLSEEAWLRVELLDPLERPLPQYSGENAGRLSADGFRQKITWNGASGIDGLNHPVKIKVTLEGEKKESIQIHALYVATRESDE